MSFASRSFATLSGLLLLQLMLLGSGTLCTMHGGEGADGTTGNAMTMARMAHQTSSHGSSVASSDDDNSPMSPADCNRPGDHDGCRLPFAPGQCSSMTACDISATLAETVGMSAYVRTNALAVPSQALTHAGPTFAPELPPPRA